MHTLNLIRFLSTGSRPVSVHSLCPALERLHLLRVLYTRQAAKLMMRNFLLLVPTERPLIFNQGGSVFSACLVLILNFCHPDEVSDLGIKLGCTTWWQSPGIQSKERSFQLVPTRTFTLKQRVSLGAHRDPFTTDLLPITAGYKSLVITCCTTGSTIWIKVWLAIRREV